MASGLTKRSAEPGSCAADGAGAGAVGRFALGRMPAYAAIARPDHWFKNVFMVLGVLLAAFYQPGLLRPEVIPPILGAVVASCLIASSNYALNEILDAPTDRRHPTKWRRPVPSGRVRLPLAYAEWLALAALGLAVAAWVNRPFLVFGLLWLFMSMLYNVPPVRTKELPYLDVLSESLNNPIRLVLGWFAVNPSQVPPVSLLIASWMIGAFFMATMRFAEFRAFGDRDPASAYRRSFRHYDEKSLLISMFFYTTLFALFFGVFIVRYHLELILFVPLVAGFVCLYAHVGFKEDSAAQNPERLYRETGLMAYLVLCAIVFVALMFVRIPALYELFNVSPSEVAPLWRL
jgi:4-hydroxybenzoate polyprenyltransferase